MGSIDVVDETYLTVAPAVVADVIADPAAWQRWWPDLSLEVFADRGEQGLRWTVTGALVGTMEIWLERSGWTDEPGTVLHYFLRADRPGPGGAPALVSGPVATAEAARRQRGAKTVALGIKRELEAGRAPGERQP